MCNMSKITVPSERSCYKEYICAIWKPPPLLVWKIWPRLIFSKVGQTSRSRSQGQKLWYHVKGLVTRNTHVQYESPTSSPPLVWKLCPRLKFLSTQPTPTRMVWLWHKHPGHSSRLAKKWCHILTNTVTTLTRDVCKILMPPFLNIWE